MMTSQTLEVALMWTAVSAYALATILFAFGLVFDKPSVTEWGVWAAAAGVVPQIAAITVRWLRVGHGPYLGFYEVVASYALLAIIVFVLIVRRYPGLSVLGVVVTPLAFLMMAASMFTSRDELEITAKLASWWLAVHVTFAKLSYACFVAAFALAVLYLLRARLASGRFADISAKLPRQEIIDDLAFKFVGVGFIFLGIMIAAGAIWANEAWGRYWAWDPIETWSLIAWLLYAAVLHVRLTLGWRDRRFAWVVVLALPVSLFAFIGVPIVYNSIHGAYLTGY